jgi:hypothetical protein
MRHGIDTQFTIYNLIIYCLSLRHHIKHRLNLHVD